MNHLPTMEESDLQSVSSEESGGGSSTHHTQSSASADVVTLRGSESSAVNRTKVLVYLSLLAAAVVTSIATFFIVRKGEEGQFEADFDVFTTHIFDTIDHKMSSTYVAVKGLSTSITSSASDSGAVWPNYTMSHFGLRSEESLTLSACESISFLPVVQFTQREGWEEYARGEHGWLDGFGSSNSGLVEPMPTEIHTAIGGEDEYLFQHVPLWQIEPRPADSSIILQDMFTLEWFRSLTEVALERDDTVISQVIVTEFMGSHHHESADAHVDEEKDDLAHESDEEDHDLRVLQHDSDRDHGQDEESIQEEDDLHHGDEEPHEEPGHEAHDDEDEDEDEDEDHSEENASPHSIVLHTVLKHFEVEHDHEHTDRDIAGYVFALLRWDDYFVGLLPEGETGYVIVAKDTCGSSFTYQINGPTATLLGFGDLHDPEYDRLARIHKFSSGTGHNSQEEHDETTHFDHSEDNDEHNEKEIVHVDCDYAMYAYPSHTMYNKYETGDPIIFAACVFLIFGVTILIFLSYDLVVERRQRRLLSTAKRTTQLVSHLFPKSVQERLIKDAEQQAKNDINLAGKRGMGKLFDDAKADESGLDKVGVDDSPPIADLFPEATIMFGDLVGFTAWSSTREPTQVFTLLETLYRAFDEIAKRRKVFKVETIGDCYVAVAGLPVARKDHPVCMARFARDCLYKMGILVKQLEEKLGPDTADLGMRIGLHSGPVTAGVLRGERARFQLFGDTVNTTARIESNGAKNSIHISEETASLIRQAGKEGWLRKREDKILAKGKGELTTYWLNLNTGSNSLHSDNRAQSRNSDENGLEKENGDSFDPQVAVEVSKDISGKHARLVNWNVQVLSKLLRTIVVRREALNIYPDSVETIAALEQRECGRPLDEVQEVITLPKYDSQVNKREVDESSVALDEDVISQLQLYIQTIAALYRQNSFHNFEHVSHVAMSVAKLLSRIVAPNLSEEEGTNEKTLHDHTYGINSDPLTQFACVFSALIHDIDHVGVPNSQLIKENATIADVYEGKSVAEQNSVDIAWSLLMDTNFDALRRVIYSTKSEFERFRSLIVNSVMATDIMDKNLSALRKARWNKAFAGEAQDEPDYANVNRKATIVIEHLIQASDVSHTMQHWHVYRKWNSRLFEEMSHAYQTGRADTDPAENWWKGEIGFFDFYIIPLAKKLKDCGVFGVSSDEYLNYAQKNRDEWENRGQEIVAEMVESLKMKKTETPKPDHDENSGDFATMRLQF